MKNLTNEQCKQINGAGAGEDLLSYAAVGFCMFLATGYAMAMDPSFPYMYGCAYS